mgnify:CR=1 FL=1
MTKKKNKNKIKYSLDTSCHIEKIKGRVKWVHKLKVQEQSLLYSPYYVLYELKYGLINDWINYYYLLEIDGPKQALNKWSDRYGHQPRKVQNVLILHGIVLEDLDNSQISDNRAYLMSVETSIYTAINIIEWNMEGFFGDFRGNEVVQYELSSRESFEEFSKIVANNKFVKFGDYIKNNQTSFEKLRDGLQARETTLEDKHKKVIDILVEVIKDHKRGDMHHNSKLLADSVITIETPDKWGLISKDKFHAVATAVLVKKFLDYSKI